MPSAAIFGCEGTSLSPAERDFFGEADPWGFILFSRNIENPAQVAALVEECRSAVGRAAAMLIDQEGGSVARLGRPHWHEWEPPGLVARTAGSEERTVAAFERRYRLIGRELLALGIDINCVPVLDLPRDSRSGAIRHRALGGTPSEVAERGRAVCRACLEEGVLPVIKHIPGHGSAGEDSHLVLPVSDATESRLKSWDFVPFRALAVMPIAMTAHVAYSALDPGVPATQSRIVIQGAVRGDIGYDGLLLSDDLCMEALSGTPSQRASGALAAGCDLALHCSGDLAEMRQMMEEVPVLSGDALRRAARVDAMRVSLSTSRRSDLAGE